MKRILSKIKYLLVLETFFYIVASIGIALIPYAEKNFVELFSEDALTVINAAGVVTLFAVAVMLYLVANYFTVVYIFKSSTQFEKEMRDACFKKLLYESRSLLTEESKDGYIHSVTAEITQLEDDYLRPMIGIVQGCLQAITYIVFIFYAIDRYIALGILILATLSVLATRSARNNASQKRNEYLECNSNFIGFIRQILNALTTVRENNIEQIINQENIRTNGVAKKRLSFGKAKAVLFTFNNGISYTTIFLFFVYTVILAHNNMITLAVAIVSFSFIDIVSEPLNLVLDSFAQIKTASDLKEKIDKRLEVYSSSVFESAPVRSIQALDIIFEKDGVPILQNISFTIEQGESCLLKGINGSGKSTLLKIISNHLTPTSGVFLINGDRPKKDTWFNDIYYVEQNAVAFPTSFVDNVTMYGAYDLAGLNKYSFTQLDVFVRIFQCENCETLSGGEKQLLSLCRALISGARWLLLDETFSGVNPSVEKAILHELIDKKNQIVYVSHSDVCESLFSKRINLSEQMEAK